MGSIIENAFSKLFSSDFISVRYSIVLDKVDSESEDKIIGGAKELKKRKITKSEVDQEAFFFLLF